MKEIYLPFVIGSLLLIFIYLVFPKAVLLMLISSPQKKILSLPKVNKALMWNYFYIFSISAILSETLYGEGWEGNGLLELLILFILLFVLIIMYYLHWLSSVSSSRLGVFRAVSRSQWWHLGVTLHLPAVLIVYFIYALNQ